MGIFVVTALVAAAADTAYLDTFYGAKKPSSKSWRDVDHLYRSRLHMRDTLVKANAIGNCQGCTGVLDYSAAPGIGCQ